MAATPIQINYIDNVTAGLIGGQEEAEYVIIPDGTTWEILRWWGTANPSTDSHVCIIWDYDTPNSQVIALSHTSEKRELKRELLGDGIKKLAIVLRNDQLSSTETLGAGYEYVVY